MPILKGELKGQLTAAELRRLIKEHNKLVSIKIPPKTDRDGLIKLIEDGGYKVDHEKQMLVPVKRVRLKKVKLPPAPVPKTAEEKAEAKKKKSAKAEAVETAGYESRKKKIDAVQRLRKGKGKVPKGSHEMPDGSIMKDKDMPVEKPKAKPVEKPKAKPVAKKSEPKKEDPNNSESKWKEYLDMVEDNKEKLLKKLRPDDKKNKNQYDYYISVFKKRKGPSGVPVTAKRMISLLSRAIK